MTSITYKLTTRSYCVLRCSAIYAIYNPKNNLLYYISGIDDFFGWLLINCWLLGILFWYDMPFNEITVILGFETTYEDLGGWYCI
jgi:hypothetical protein